LLALPDDIKSAFDPSTLRAVAHGAAMCPADVKQAMIDWWGPVLREYYAATEVGIVAASTSLQWLAHPGTVGRAPDGVDIKIVDDDGRTLRAGEIGEILIRSDVTTLVTYRNRPEAVSEMRRDDWVTLGDVGYINETGFLWICDRKKDMVISGGVNIYPAEIEQVLCADSAVRDCVVFGVPDRDLGEILIACVELEPDATSTQAGLQEQLRLALGRLRVPRVVRFVQDLPREDSGKLARRKVKAAYLELLLAEQA
jgi:long-chain acyl-CoA synthetase